MKRRRDAVQDSGTDSNETVYRRILMIAVSAVCRQNGFEAVKPAVLTTLVEIVHCQLTDLCHSAKMIAEVAGRPSLIPSDVIVALVEAGLPVASLLKSVKDSGRIIIPPPRQSVPQHEPKVYRVGKVRPHPPYIPSHLPQFPDPHTYLRTESHMEFTMDYQSTRETVAQRQQQMQKSLVSFMLKIHPTMSIKFGDEELKFMEPRPEPAPYVSALLPEDVRQLSSEYEGDEESDEHELSSVDNPFLKPAKIPKGAEGF